MSTTALDILTAIGDSPALQEVARVIATRQSFPTPMAIQGELRMPHISERAHRKCGYCGRLSFNAKAETCAGCSAPFKEPK